MSNVELDSSIFSGKLKVRILDLQRHQDGQVWKQYEFEDSKLFEDQFRNRECVKLRIVSFRSQATCLPILASRRDWETISNTFPINPEFEDTLSAFGRFPDPANGHNTIPRVSVRESSLECWYRLQYPALNNRSKENPWSIRHTGVYYQTIEEGNFTLIILIHPCRDSPLEIALFNDDERVVNKLRFQLVSSPTNIHRIVCDMYLPNWSLYIKYQSQEQRQVSDDVQTSDLKTGNLDADFGLTQQLRYLKNTVATSRVLCLDNVTVLHELTRAFEIERQNVDYIAATKAKAEARCNSLVLLQERVENDIDLLEHAATQRDSRINRRNQKIATKLNETLLNLTYNTVDDSATIKVITIFSLIFLPGSFIAAIFGTNFFVFNQDQTDGSGNDNTPAPGLVVGHNFWWFIAIWLPVTAFVVGVYLFVIHRRQRLERRRRKMLIHDENEQEVRQNGEDEKADEDV